jgi:hypothetical protein
MHVLKLRDYIKLAWAVATGERHSFRLERIAAKLTPYTIPANRAMKHTRNNLLLDIERRAK